MTGFEEERFQKKTAKQMVKVISNSNLKKHVDELIDFHRTGILKDGMTKEFANQLVANLGEAVMPYKLQMAENLILMEAATRFANMYSV